MNKRTFFAPTSTNYNELPLVQVKPLRRQYPQRPIQRHATFHWSMLVTDRHRGHLFIYFLPHNQRAVPGAAVAPHLVDCGEDFFLALK